MSNKCVISCQNENKFLQNLPLLFPRLANLTPWSISYDFVLIKKGWGQVRPKCVVLVTPIK